MADLVDKIQAQWRSIRPEVDTSPIAVAGRVLRCATLLLRASEELLATYGLSRPEFDVLSALRRADGQATPGQLSREMLSSGAATTKRLSRLEEAGLVRRTGDSRDKRVIHLALTPAGRQLIDRILPAHIAVERDLLAVLDPAAQEQLAALLATLLHGLEGVSPASPAEADRAGPS
jgi:DNA-binding MarR family transcriptional regulator